MGLQGAEKSLLCCSLGQKPSRNLLFVSFSWAGKAIPSASTTAGHDKMGERRSHVLFKRETRQSDTRLDRPSHTHTHTHHPKYSDKEGEKSRGTCSFDIPASFVASPSRLAVSKCSQAVSPAFSSLHMVSVSHRGAGGAPHAFVLRLFSSCVKSVRDKD